MQNINFVEIISGVNEQSAENDNFVKKIMLAISKFINVSIIVNEFDISLNEFDISLDDKKKYEAILDDNPFYQQRKEVLCSFFNLLKEKFNSLDSVQKISFNCFFSLFVELVENVKKVTNDTNDKNNHKNGRINVLKKYIETIESKKELIYEIIACLNKFNDEKFNFYLSSGSSSSFYLLKKIIHLTIDLKLTVNLKLTVPNDYCSVKEKYIYSCFEGKFKKCIDAFLRMEKLTVVGLEERRNKKKIYNDSYRKKNVSQVKKPLTNSC